MNHHLTRYRSLARALDARFRIPGTPVRFGWDAVLGLVPGVGDAIAGLLGGYGLYVGTKLGAPWIVLARMLLNLAVDLLVGSVPVAGDIFDVAWRGNLRNLALLERWLERPHETRSRSAALFLALFGVLAGLAGLVLWFSLWLLRALLHP
jgi:Domain of unknown function (DUF4112)